MEQRIAETSEGTIREVIALESFLAEHGREQAGTDKERRKKWDAVMLIAGSLGVPRDQFMGFLVDCAHIILDEAQNAPRGYSVVNQRRHYGARAVDRFDALLGVLDDHPATHQALRDLSQSWSRQIDWEEHDRAHDAERDDVA